MKPSVHVFNPFAEGYIAQGKAFTPVERQASLADDLAALPQFFCQPGDIVLVRQRPSAAFVGRLQEAGFPPPEFVELPEGRIDHSSDLCRRRLGGLRPWAWGPDSLELLEPLFAGLPREARSPALYFNENIARLYSKAWSAEFLRRILARGREAGRASGPEAETPSVPGGPGDVEWLCSEQEAGTVADTVDDALDAIAAIRRRGHHRVVVKEAYGVAGHNAIRLWEPELLPAQHRWLAHALRRARQLVIEPWLERELDFSVQLEMGPRGLAVCGYTGLLNDHRGQFLANWAEADYAGGLPAKAAALLGGQAGVSERLHRLYDEVFSLLEAELQRVGFVGPVSVDALVYRTAQGDCRLKPVVEINPRYTMGRLTVELMKHACPGSCGLFRLVTPAQANKQGFADLASYARGLAERAGLRLEAGPAPNIRRGALCLNDPARARACLATFDVNPASPLPDLPIASNCPRPH